MQIPMLMRKSPVLLEEQEPVCFCGQLVSWRQWRLRFSAEGELCLGCKLLQFVWTAIENQAFKFNGNLKIESL